MSDDAKEELVDFLNEKAFQPVLDRSPDDYSSDSDRQKLAEVKGATRRELHRYRDEYSSASEVIQEFHDDLNSEEAKKVTRELHDLNLPALCDIEGEFAKKVQEEGFQY